MEKENKETLFSYVIEPQNENSFSINNNIQIKYPPKGKKNLSKKFGSSVFIKNAINIGDKRMQIQIGKILFETQRMKFGEFDKNRKRRKTKYPLPSKY